MLWVAYGLQQNSELKTVRFANMKVTTLILLGYNSSAKLSTASNMCFLCQLLPIYKKWHSIDLNLCDHLAVDQTFVA